MGILGGRRLRSVGEVAGGLTTAPAYVTPAPSVSNPCPLGRSPIGQCRRHPAFPFRLSGISPSLPPARSARDLYPSFNYTPRAFFLRLLLLPP